MTERVCRTCGKAKPVSAFPMRTTGLTAGKVYPNCRACSNLRRQYTRALAQHQGFPGTPGQDPLVEIRDIDPWQRLAGAVLRRALYDAEGKEMSDITRHTAHERDNARISLTLSARSWLKGGQYNQDLEFWLGIAYCGNQHLMDMTDDRLRSHVEASYATPVSDGSRPVPAGKG